MPSIQSVPHKCLLNKVNLLKIALGTSLVVDWLRLCPSTLESTGSIPGQGSSAYLEVWPKKKIAFENS